MPFFFLFLLSQLIASVAPLFMGPPNATIELFSILSLYPLVVSLVGSSIFVRGFVTTLEREYSLSQPATLTVLIDSTKSRKNRERIHAARNMYTLHLLAVCCQL